MAPAAKDSAKRNASTDIVPTGKPLEDFMATQASKKARTRTEEAENKRQHTTYLGYQMSAKCKNEDSKAEAQSMHKEYHSLDADMANKFATKFMDTKKSKDFTWHKNFLETLTSSKEDQHQIKENYLTPIWPQCCMNTPTPILAGA